MYKLDLILIRIINLMRKKISQHIFGSSRENVH